MLQPAVESLYHEQLRERLYGLPLGHSRQINVEKQFSLHSGHPSDRHLAELRGRERQLLAELSGPQLASDWAIVDPNLETEHLGIIYSLEIKQHAQKVKQARCTGRYCRCTLTMLFTARR